MIVMTKLWEGGYFYFAVCCHMSANVNMITRHFVRSLSNQQKDKMVLKNIYLLFRSASAKTR